MSTIFKKLRLTFRLYGYRLRGNIKVFAALQKCGCSELWERSDLGEGNPGAANGGGAYTDLSGDVIFLAHLP
jgi:hypothetical protein